jgi:hypothetical protein
MLQSPEEAVSVPVNITLQAGRSPHGTSTTAMVASCNTIQHQNQQDRLKLNVLNNSLLNFLVK